MQDDRDAVRCAQAALEAFSGWQRDFRAITRRAHQRFVERDWHGIRRDVVDRLDVYTHAVSLLTRVVRRRLGPRIEDRELWSRIRSTFAERTRGLPERELAETFFNSLTRQIFTTVGVDTSIEFVDSGTPQPSAADLQPVVVSFERRGDLDGLVREALAASPLAELLYDAGATAGLIARQIDAARRSTWGDQEVDSIELLRPLFYRGFGTYLIGRVRSGGGFLPLAVSFLSDERGVGVDAVLLDENEVSVVFSFTRSYFLVDLDHPAAVVLFLKAIMPQKPIAELYTALGYNKHGKTVLYRGLVRHPEQTSDLFIEAPGDRGMVMIVFTMPSFDVVFKVIRDTFAYPKNTVREDVQDRYRLVFRHDRAGRLVDAQVFEHLTFDRERFSDALLEVLAANATESVQIRGQEVVLEHVYTERRMTPLNLYLQSATDEQARSAVLDYGHAVRDLAASNIFPGDLLLKNFGVTRHGRIVFYDYDELCLLTDCKFRDLPAASDTDDELRGEAWFYVGPNDIFPQEFRSFLGLPKALMDCFDAAHGDLFRADWWRKMQTLHRDGVDTRIFAYPDHKRLHGPGAALP